VSKRLEFDDFVLIARKVHGTRYRYYKNDYVNSHVKTKILCKDHGPFYLIPKKHIYRGDGCPKCGKINGGLKIRSSQKEFLRRAYKIHGNKYDYKKTKYERMNDPVLIGCRQHGIFKQKPHSHLSGRGCVQCAYEKRARGHTYTHEQVVRLFKKTHGNRYDYSLVKYHRAKEKVKIICKKHGVFEQDPFDHYSVGTGCPYCNESKGERAIEKFLKKKK
jgi:hypothetical protein